MDRPLKWGVTGNFASCRSYPIIFNTCYCAMPNVHVRVHDHGVQFTNSIFINSSAP
jgi:hypothetical protein